MAKKAFITADMCDGSPMCPAKRVCPQKAITQKGGLFFGGGISNVNEDKCTGCGICLRYCPMGAISLKNI